MCCPKRIPISAYLDEELSGKDRAALESHVQGCARCGAALKDMRSLRAAFAYVERHQAPYGFATRVIARSSALDKKRSRWLIQLSLRFAEAVVLSLVITVGILAGRVMTNSSSASKSMNIVSSLSLDLFEATPPGSLGNAYLAMTEVKHEK
jgi:anti-sigma factor RsiW